MVGGEIRKSTMYAVFNNGKILKESFDKWAIIDYLKRFPDDDLKLLDVRKKVHGSMMWKLVNEDELMSV